MHIKVNLFLFLGNPAADKKPSMLLQLLKSGNVKF